MFVWGHQPASQATGGEEPSTRFLSKFHWGGGGGEEEEVVEATLEVVSTTLSMRANTRPALQTLSSTLDTGNFSAAANYFLAFDPRVWWHMHPSF